MRGKKIDAQETIGKTFGKLTVIRPVDQRVRNQRAVECKCECGKVLPIGLSDLLAGCNKSCGCSKLDHNVQRAAKARQKATSLIGGVFGRLTPLRLSDDSLNHDGRVCVHCQCECGNTADVHYADLLRGQTQSCGCLSVDNAKGLAKLSTAAMIASGRAEADPKLRTAKRIYRTSYKDGDLSFQEFIELSRKECFYCGVTPSNSMTTSGGSIFIYNGLDRVDNERGHMRDNVVPCCIVCNTAKNNMSSNDFFAWVRRVHERHC